MHKALKSSEYIFESKISDDQPFLDTDVGMDWYTLYPISGNLDI